MTPEQYLYIGRARAETRPGGLANSIRSFVKTTYNCLESKASFLSAKNFPITTGKPSPTPRRSSTRCRYGRARPQRVPSGAVFVILRDAGEPILQL
jgi:hypothetical protein